MTTEPNEAMSAAEVEAKIEELTALADEVLEEDEDDEEG